MGAGQEEYGHLRPMSYTAADVVMICFSVVNVDSFENVQQHWLAEVKAHCPQVPYLLVGTHTDLRNYPLTGQQLIHDKDKYVSYNQGKKLSSKIGAANYVECSALTQDGLKDVFDEAI